MFLLLLINCTILGSNNTNSSNNWRGGSIQCVQVHLGLIPESLLTSTLVSKYVYNNLANSFVPGTYSIVLS